MGARMWSRAGKGGLPRASGLGFGGRGDACVGRGVGVWGGPRAADGGVRMGARRARTGSRSSPPRRPVCVERAGSGRGPPRSGLRGGASPVVPSSSPRAPLAEKPSCRKRPDGGWLEPRPRGARRGSGPFTPPSGVARRGGGPRDAAVSVRRCALTPGSGGGGGTVPAASSGPEPRPLGVSLRVARVAGAPSPRAASAGTPSGLPARLRDAPGGRASLARRGPIGAPLGLSPSAGVPVRVPAPLLSPSLFSRSASFPSPSETRPQIRRGDPLNLSILVSGGKETNQDSLSNGE